MSAEVYSLEDSVERAVILALAENETLAAFPAVPALKSSETPLPMIVVKAQRTNEVVRDMGTWEGRLEVSLVTPADETDPDEVRTRLQEAPVDLGATLMVDLWRELWATVTSSGFASEINDTDLTYIWAFEWEPVATDYGDRTFRRTLAGRFWANQVTDLDDE